MLSFQVTVRTGNGEPYRFSAIGATAGAVYEAAAARFGWLCAVLVRPA
jgi:hypothetical protein